MDKYIIFIRAFGLKKLDTYHAVHRLGYKIAIAADREFHDINNALADHIIYTDTSNSDKLITDISEFGCKHEVAAVLTYLEQTIELAAAAAAVIGCKGPSWDAVKVCRNKYLTRLRTSQNNTISPKFFVARSLEEIREKIFLVKMPIIMKPMNMAGACAVVKVDSLEELDTKYNYMLRRRDDAPIKKSMVDTTDNYWLIEEYVEGFEISVEAYAFEGKTRIVTIHDKVFPVEAPDFVEGMSATPSPRISNELREQIERQTAEVFEAVGFQNGVAHIEYRISEKGPVLVEVNARPGGGLVVESTYYATGINLNELLIKICLGIDPGIQEINVRPTVLNEICPPEGTIKEVLGVEGLKQNKDLILVEQRVKAGDTIYTSSAQLGVLILGVGEHIEELMERMKKISSEVIFLMETGS